MKFDDVISFLLYYLFCRCQIWNSVEHPFNQRKDTATKHKVLYILLLPSINFDSNIKFAGFLPLGRFSFLGTVVLNKLSSPKLPSMYKIESELHQDGPWI